MDLAATEAVLRIPGGRGAKKVAGRQGVGPTPLRLGGRHEVERGVDAPGLDAVGRTEGDGPRIVDLGAGAFARAGEDSGASGTGEPVVRPGGDQAVEVPEGGEGGALHLAEGGEAVVPGVVGEGRPR